MLAIDFFHRCPLLTIKSAGDHFADARFAWFKRRFDSSDLDMLRRHSSRSGSTSHLNIYKNYKVEEVKHVMYKNVLGIPSAE